MERKRLSYIDSIRGITIVSMIAYHFTWDLVYLAGWKLDWMKSFGAYCWQQSICWTFIILSGFCWSMGHHPIRHGLQIFACGALITVVTLLFLPEDRIIFGILTFLGSAMILMYLMQPLLKRCHPLWGMLLSFFIFVMTKGVSRHHLGWGILSIALPDALYRNYLTAYLGFFFKGFYSTDYFAIIPWIFLYIFGYYLYWSYDRYLRDRDHIAWKEPVFSFLGRHSIWIYMMHQPLLYLLVMLLTRC